MALGVVSWMAAISARYSWSFGMCIVSVILTAVGAGLLFAARRYTVVQGGVISGSHSHTTTTTTTVVVKH
jgi:hypothetical protein